MWMTAADLAVDNRRQVTASCGDRTFCCTPGRRVDALAFGHCACDSDKATGIVEHERIEPERKGSGRLWGYRGVVVRIGDCQSMLMSSDRRSWVIWAWHRMLHRIVGSTLGLVNEIEKVLVDELEADGLGSIGRGELATDRCAGRTTGLMLHILKEGSKMPQLHLGSLLPRLFLRCDSGFHGLARTPPRHLAAARARPGGNEHPLVALGTDGDSHRLGPRAVRTASSEPEEGEDLDVVDEEAALLLGELDRGGQDVADLGPAGDTGGTKDPESERGRPGHWRGSTVGLQPVGGRWCLGRHTCSVQGV